MSKLQYVDSFKKYLHDIRKSQRDEIIKDVEANLRDFDGKDDTIAERFGTPEELAIKYKSGLEIVPTFTQRLYNISKISMLCIGVVCVSLITGLGSLAYYFNTEKRFDFNYQDIMAAKTHFEDGWQSIDWEDQNSIQLDISQSYLLIYWHEEKQLIYRCNGQELAQEQFAQEQFAQKSSDPNMRVAIIFAQSRCVVYLPYGTSHIKSHQSEIFLMSPQHDITLTSMQSKAHIDGALQVHKFEIKTKQSNVDAFVDGKNASNHFKIIAEQSRVMAYEPD